MTINPRSTPPGEADMKKPAQDETKPAEMHGEETINDECSTKKSVESIDDISKLVDNFNLDDGKEDDLDENEVPIFPNDLLTKLDEMVNKPKWIIPVLPKAELELLMDATIKLAKKGLDVKSEACQRFIREGMTISYNKILLDDAVSTWKFEIHKYILKNTEKLLELCVVKLDQDWFPLLDLLAIALNPNSRFHMYNAGKPSETVPMVSANVPEEKPPFARPFDHRQPKGWVVDLVNSFGGFGGFEKLTKRFCEMGNLNVPVICALIKPFGLCAEVLSEKTVEIYLMPVILVIKKFLESLTDEVLKKESKTESKNEAITIIIKSMKSIVTRLSGQEELCKDLEKLRLHMILRLLQVSPFNGKMNALNEINRVISSVSYYSHHRHSGFDEDEYLTHDMVAKWLHENDVLVIVLKENLHQPQYVEKLEKIIRFTIKARTLTLHDLDTIWMAQNGKHEAIVKNVHDLLAKLAWDFSAEQLDHLFSRFQTSWNVANKKQQEKLLELIRRLAEDDKEGVIAHKVLGLLWQLSHSDDLHTDIMDQALNAHIKILDYSCSQTQDRDSLKIRWINICVDELRGGIWVIPALKQIRAICELFYEGSGQVSNPHVLYRNTVVESVQNKHAVVSLVAENLSRYMNKIREMHKSDLSIDPLNLKPDGRYTHVMQIQERLDFLRFVLNDGKMWLCEPQAEQIWICLAINCVFPVDRDVCFKWFSKVMGDDPDLDPEITKQFFENNVLKINPSNLNEHGLRCFERFFKYVNQKEGLLSKKRNGTYILENIKLIGYDYLWKVIIEAPLEIANSGIEILKEVSTNFGINLRPKQNEIHTQFITNCYERLQPSEKLLSSIKQENCDNRVIIQQEARKIMLCLKTLREYVAESDNHHTEERAFVPHNRSCRGKQICLYIRFSPQNRNMEDFEIWTHNNESLASIRRTIYNKLKMSPQAIKFDIYNNSELINPVDDRKLIGDLMVKDRTVFTVKLGSTAGSVPSSPDSSSDSSPPPTPQPGDGPNLETEKLLPGVILSKKKFADILFGLGNLATKFQVFQLRDIILSLLDICPSDVETIQEIKNVCHECAHKSNSTANLDKFFFSHSPIQVLYNLEVIYALLLPSSGGTDHLSMSFQQDFILAGGVQCILKMFAKTQFLSGSDNLIKRSAFTVLLKISKFLFTAIAFAHITVVAEALQKDPKTITSTQHNYAVTLQQAIQHIPHNYLEYMLRTIAIKLGQSLRGHAINHIPDLHIIQKIQHICWASAIGNLSLLQSDIKDIHQHYELGEVTGVCQEDISLSKEAFEVLTIALALCPSILEKLIRDKQWHLFIIDILLLCKDRAIRITAADQCFLIASKCSNGDTPLRFFIQLLFTVRDSKVLDHPLQSSEYFSLLCKLLNYGRSIDFQLANATKILEQEIKWIKNVQSKYLASPDSPAEIVHHELLEGHLGITKELLAYHSIQKRFSVGCEDGGDKLLMSLINDFIFSASKLEVLIRTGGGDASTAHVNPICNTPPTIVAALDLLVALCTNCIPNLRLLSDSLSELYYSGYDGTLSEWEYQPPIGPRPATGYVGLKNAGATCYMNSVLQQLYMIPEIKGGVLSAADVGYNDVDEDCDEEGGEKGMKEAGFLKEDIAVSVENKEQQKQQERQQYNTKILSHIQTIFGHLYGSKLQFYIPKGFWKSFRLWGEPVNLREQHDAYEFFNTLVDNIDEGLKAAGYEMSCTKALGGSFADQKICKQCPHRYSRETPFTALNVDVRNHHNLIDSLEQYVKGDLLEGANAYHCERCDKKVDTVKRMCIKKLPQVLAIQLKRFDYDWERDCAVKFNDYFEFPREFNLEPFTVEGLAKVEGEIIEDDMADTISTKSEDVPEKEATPQSTVYKLMGVVVHSGQASGGHYYSYIIPRNKIDGQQKWYKFDDGDVCECNMHDDEELKNQCFGGEYMGEVFDHMIKRRQKRWWNAYLLFYERLDVLNKFDRKNSFSDEKLQIPSLIQRSVRKENIQFLHTRTQFSVEYFQFVRKLTLASPLQQLSKPNDPVREELCLISLQLLCKFLFTVGFHTKKSIRGPSNDWYEAISALVRQGVSLRRWFVIDVLLARPDRIIEYLLECPVAEIRSMFGRVIVLLAHLTRADGSFSIELLSTPLETWQVKNCDPTKSTLSDYLLRTVLHVLHRDDNNSRHLLQYFQLFLMYAGIGVAERKQLLDLGVLLTFIRLAIEEDRNSSGKYQFAELSKLYSLVSLLIRSCDVSKYMKSSNQNELPKANPYFDHLIGLPIMEIPADVEGLIYTSNYVKKLLEESNASEDTIPLMKFLSWECLSFSMIALSEVLFQISYAYTYELRPYLDILLHLLLMNDSWQEHRLKCAFTGVSDDREGLFDTIQRSKSHSHKRGYQCIKAIVQLTQNCDLALQMLMEQDDLKEKWKSAVRWLGDELERRAPSAYNYNNWSPPTQSNETSNGYFLERSHSARFTYSKACEMFDEEEEEEEEEEDESELVESFHQAGEHAEGNIHYTCHLTESDGIKCPPYAEVVMSAPTSAIDLNPTDNMTVETSAMEGESDN